MSLVTYCLECGRHVARLRRRRRRRRRRAYAPTSNTACHITMRKSTHGFPSLSYTCLSMGLPLGVPEHDVSSMMSDHGPESRETTLFPP